jgi:hypothetical protein
MFVAAGVRGPKFTSSEETDVVLLVYVVPVIAGVWAWGFSYENPSRLAFLAAFCLGGTRAIGTGYHSVSQNDP